MSVSQHLRETTAARQDILDRVDDEFAEALFFKPSDVYAGTPEFALAPLIVQEIRYDPTAEPLRDRFGSLVDQGEDALPYLDRTRPTVYVSKSTLEWKGKDYDQVSYAWVYRLGHSGDPRQPGEGSCFQGVRLTLNSVGEPVLFETADSGLPVHQVFVAESLERAAIAQYGGPLPEKRFAIENNSPAAFRAVIPRLIADGPVAMGPFVYLAADTRQVTTVLCRCMSSQVSQFRETSTYELQPLDWSQWQQVGPRYRPRFPDVLRGFIGDGPSATATKLVEDTYGLVRFLRLPDAF